jgi:hypothetical protein
VAALESRNPRLTETLAAAYERAVQRAKNWGVIAAVYLSTGERNAITTASEPPDHFVGTIVMKRERESLNHEYVSS